MRRRDARFQQLALDSTIGQLMLHELEERVETYGPEAESEREAVITFITDSVRAALFDSGVPEGFHNNCLRLLQHDAATGFKSPLKCRSCRTFIGATRDYACSLKQPSCRACASVTQVYA